MWMWGFISLQILLLFTRRVHFKDFKSRTSAHDFLDIPYFIFELAQKYFIFHFLPLPS